MQDVVIVGAGPTGLALAAELRRLGVSALLFDKEIESSSTSRATVVHARTLEVLESLGVSQRLIERGLVLHAARLHEGGSELASISFNGLETAYSFLLICTQDQTEAVLNDRLRELGGAVTRCIQVTEVRPAPDHVDATYVAAGVLVQDIQAKWLIGCDGSHSTVREQAGIAFEGGDYEENFVLADFEMTGWPLGREHMDLFFSPEGLLLVVPLPGDRFRMIATVPVHGGDPTLGDVQSILDARVASSAGTKTGARVTGIVWASHYKIQHRVAAQLRKGRVLILGDAAHVHSPAGGQGMNTGVQDAVALAQALKTVINTGDESALAEWERKRLEIARSVVRTTDTMTRVAATDNAAMHLLRNALVGLVGHVPALQHALAERLSEIDNR